MLSHEKIIGTVGYLGGVMSLPEPFTYSWGNLCAFTQTAICQPGEHVHFDRAKVSLHDFARNDLAGRFRGDWLIMLDTDITFDPDLAARLVYTANKFNCDILSGMYSYKSYPYCPVAYMFNPETERHEIICDWDKSTDIFEIDSAGAGCLFVKRTVFERIVKHFKCNPFDRIKNKGEDHSFFIRCRLLGIQAYCAWKIEAQHLDYRGFAPSTSMDARNAPSMTFNLYDAEGFKASA